MATPDRSKNNPPFTSFLPRVFARSEGKIASILAASLLAASPLAAQPTTNAPRTNVAGDSFFGQDVVPGQVIVRYKLGASASRKFSTLAAAGATFKRSLLLAGAELVSVEPGREEEAAARLSRDPSVEYAEPDRIVRAYGTPDDTQFVELWGLNNTGQIVNGVAGTRDADIDAVEAWDTGKGISSSVRVAVIDTGVTATHPDLAPNMFINPGESGSGKETNGIDDDVNGKIDDFRGWDFVNNDNDPDDDNGHGTHVAGTIGAESNNALGVAGVASLPPSSGANWRGPRIIPLKVLNASGNGSFSNVIDAIVYAGTLQAKVGNLSLGGSGVVQAIDDAFRSQPGTLFVVAAGNDGTNNDTTPRTPCVPATLPDAPNKICVAATDSKDLLATFSNFGATHVDLAAPGVSILSTVPASSFGFSNGTSMATPHVAGAAAFLIAKYPGADPASITQKILRGVDKKPNLAGQVLTGGRLNLYKAAAESKVSKSGSVLTFAAGPGETNNVKVTRIVESGVARFRFTDNYSTSPTAIQSGSRLVPGAGCAAVPGQDTQVKCLAAGITRIVVLGSDLNDSIDAATIAIPVTLNGGPGNDILIGGSQGDLLTGGPGRDSFTGGGGSDTLNTKDDTPDLLFKCGESAGDTDRVNGDASPNDAVTANPNNCEVVNKS